MHYSHPDSAWARSASAWARVQHIARITVADSFCDANLASQRPGSSCLNMVKTSGTIYLVYASVKQKSWTEKIFDLPSAVCQLLCKNRGEVSWRKGHTMATIISACVEVGGFHDWIGCSWGVLLGLWSRFGGWNSEGYNLYSWIERNFLLHNGVDLNLVFKNQNWLWVWPYRL